MYCDLSITDNDVTGVGGAGGRQVVPQSVVAAVAVVVAVVVVAVVVGSHSSFASSLVSNSFFNLNISSSYASLIFLWANSKSYTVWRICCISAACCWYFES